MLPTFSGKVKADGAICLWEQVELPAECEVLVTALDKNTLLALIGPSGEIRFLGGRLQEEQEESEYLTQVYKDLPSL